MDMTNPIYTDKDKAREYLEAIRWPSGVVCPHCDCTGKITKLQGKSTRSGVYKCNDCRKPFTVTVGSLFEDSKVALNKWVLAAHLMAASKKGMSAHQLHRMIGVTYKTAWFMFHRIREAMRNDEPGNFGSGGGMVEIDETFIGRNKAKDVKPGVGHKYKILALVDRNTGMSRAVVIDDLKVNTIAPIVRANVAKEATLMTDEAGYYKIIGRRWFDGHEFVRHGDGEYGRGEAHTNTIEGYFSIFKRGMKGVYQHCGRQHLHRYVAEFEFRYNHHRTANDWTDTERAAAS